MAPRRTGVPVNDPYVQPPTPPVSGIPADHRQWAMFAHLSALIGGALTGVAGGWGTVIGPLIIWLVKKDSMPFVADQGREALNFNITMAVIFLALWLFTVLTIGIGIVITLPLGVLAVAIWLVLVIIAAVRANEGREYRYPFAIRLIR